MTSLRRRAVYWRASLTPTVPCGAHGCTYRRDAAFLEDHIAAFDLRVHNDDQAARPNDSLHSIIDQTLSAPSAGPSRRYWRIVEGEDQASPSDHVIEWKWSGTTERVDPK